jgi:glycosyltransferase involved in cell wall biosynthesis
LNPIKVIYILNSPTKHGGANKSFINMVDGLIEKGVVPTVILPHRGDLCAELDNRKITYHFTPFFLSVYPSRNNFRDYLIYFLRLFRTLYVNYKAFKGLVTLVNKIEPNFIHSNVGPILIGYNIAKRLKIPHFWHIREYQDLDFNMNPLFSMDGFIKKLNMPNNYPIAITKGIFNHFSLSDEARVISNGVFKANFSQFKIQKQKYFLFAGRLEENKGIKNLLAAFFEFAITNNEYFLYIAGNTEDITYKKSLISMVDKSGFKERIKFLGMRDDLIDLMAYATALIVPSIHEGFGRITVEAMFNGCLVIGNNSGGTKEILENENLGILYFGHDELVISLKKVVSKGIEHFYPMIEKAQEQGIELYSQEQNVKAVYEFYEEILSQNYKK